MRLLSALALYACVLAPSASAENWLFEEEGSHRLPCIPHLHPCSTTITTTSSPRGFPSFEQGVARALGFGDVSSCMKGTDASVGELWQSAQEYLHGNLVAKAKALKNIAKAIEHIVEALGPCIDTMSDVVDLAAMPWRKLYDHLKDPLYYTAHNALTLGLNLAENHLQLGRFKTAWEEGDYYIAGYELTLALLHVLGNLGALIPISSGKAAIQIAWGLAEGFTTDIDLQCFKDVRVEIPALIGGVMDIMSVVDIANGLESLFHGLKGIVPTYKDCMADEPSIVELLERFSDFQDPMSLAKTFVKHIMENRRDLSLETEQAVLDFKGAEWKRFGQDIGHILQNILIGAVKDASLPIVV